MRCIIFVDEANTSKYEILVHLQKQVRNKTRGTLLGIQHYDIDKTISIPTFYHITLTFSLINSHSN